MDQGRKRIARWFWNRIVATINKLLKQFRLMSNMMKKMSKGDLKGMSDPRKFLIQSFSIN